MITIVIKDIPYKDTEQEGFETLRDEIYNDSITNTGCIAASYSPKTLTAIFAFVDEFSIPEKLKRHAKHYHPVTPHTHKERHADGGYE